MNDPNYELKKGDYIIIPKSGKSLVSKSVNTSDKAIKTSSKSVKLEYCCRCTMLMVMDVVCWNIIVACLWLVMT